MLLSKRVFILVIFFLAMHKISAQSRYELSVGLSMPDKVSNKYFKHGVYLSYGIDFKITNSFFINSNFSVSYNGTSSSYRHGLDDSPYLQSNPEIKQEVESFWLSNVFDSDIYKTFLFNTSVGLNIKYLVLHQNKFSPYFGVGFGGNFSFYQDQYDVFSPDESIGFPSIESRGIHDGKELSFSYQGLGGVHCNLKSRKSIFVELVYKKFFNPEFGLAREKAGLFFVHFGISFPFTKA